MLVALTKIKEVVANLAVLSLCCPFNDSRNAIVSMHKVRRDRDYINVTIQIDRVSLVIVAITMKEKDTCFVIPSRLMKKDTLTVKFVLQELIDDLNRRLLREKIACTEQDIERSMLGLHRPDLGAQVAQIAIGRSYHQSIFHRYQGMKSY